MAEIVDVLDIARQVRLGRGKSGSLGKVVFLIGAGCSVSAGIPAVKGLAQKFAPMLAVELGLCDEGADPVEAFKLLKKENSAFGSFLTGPPGNDLTEDTIDWYKTYDEIFRTYYKSPDQVRSAFAKVVNDAGGTINWAHLCLGELVRHQFVSTVLTTNFDRLVLSGMIYAGVMPVVCDGLDSLNRIKGDPPHPQLLEIHGSCHTYQLRNSLDACRGVMDSPEAQGALRSLIQYANCFVAVGYGGREEGVMNLLIQGAKEFKDKHLFWVNYSAQPDDISHNANVFLSTSKNSGVCVGQDADKFFLELCKLLKIYPLAIQDPLEALRRGIEKVCKSTVTDPVIKAAIDGACSRLDALTRYDLQVQRKPSNKTLEINRALLLGQYDNAYRIGKEAINSATGEEDKA